MTLIAYIFSAISGGVLFASGLLHAWQPFYFQQQIAAYEVVPAGFAPLLGVYLPYLQIIVGFALIAGVLTPEAIYIAAVFYLSFALVQAFQFSFGKSSISCGCFGSYSQQISLSTIGIPLVLFCITMLAIFVRRPADANLR